MVELVCIGMLACYVVGIYVGRHWSTFTEE